MPYRFKRRQPTAQGARRMAAEQIDRCLGEIEDPQLSDDHTVHQVRKRCKKLRALLRLIRYGLADSDTYKRENACFRDAARSLSDARDAQVILDAFDALQAGSGDGSPHPCTQSAAAAKPCIAPVREGLLACRDRSAGDAEEIDQALKAFSETIIAAKARIEDWPIKDSGFDLLAGGLKRTYRRGRAALKDALEDPTAENLHELRKRVKYHRYQLRSLRDLWAGVVNARRKQAAKLSTLLGDDHDLAVLRETLLAEPDTFGGSEAVAGAVDLIDASRLRYADRALALARLIYVEKPKAFTRRMNGYWRNWRRG